ncbi:hypothetical protein CCHR01_05515 [Colletotrichum chrysophilum]|uniref:Uncharacterized protein n=1 Tax=Colletotrichum chrysophilum TaxID=1836956 RepID=A0AAD9EKG5_9PEZI|nr:hypothetical protein CCHR01_05515 [Colletotrichum chrysophilum]
MQFSKAFIVIAAAVMPSVMAACSPGAPFQGSCLSCTSECWDSLTTRLTARPTCSVLVAWRSAWRCATTAIKSLDSMTTPMSIGEIVKRRQLLLEKNVWLIGDPSIMRSI